MTREEVVKGLEGILATAGVSFMYVGALRAAIALLTPPDPLPDDVRQAMFAALKARIAALEAKLARVREAAEHMPLGTTKELRAALADEATE